MNVLKIKNWFKGIIRLKTVLASQDGKTWYRFKVHRGNQIWLEWFGHPFPLEMKEDGNLIIKDKNVRGYNKVYPSWRWREDDNGKYQNSAY